MSKTKQANRSHKPKGQASERAKGSSAKSRQLSMPTALPRRAVNLFEDENPLAPGLQLSILKRGITEWNYWRDKHPRVRPDFRGVDLRAANLRKANFRGTDFRGANLSVAIIREADLSGAYLRGTDLTGADLRDADLSGADFSGAKLYGADLREANLSRAIFVETKLNHAKLSNCRIYGLSAWNIELEQTDQTNLIITRADEPTITVDNLEVAQFIYLLLNNQKIRDVIDTITSKVVLILGRFSPERKVVLDALRKELRSQNYLPILFDFDKPINRDLTETISTLAHIARFIIADITDAKSIPQELQAIVPHLPSVPIQPLLEFKTTEYGMFEHFERYSWVLTPYRYDSVHHLLATLTERVILPAETKARELRS